MQNAAEHYFVTENPNITVQDQIMLTQWLLRGMALDAHLADNERYFERYVALWAALLGNQVRVRSEVKAPPKRPEDWSEPTVLPATPPARQKPAKPKAAAAKPRKPKA
jgi:hypothetical protein